MPIEINSITSITIQYSGARMSNTTKEVWKIMRKTSNLETINKSIIVKWKLRNPNRLDNEGNTKLPLKINSITSIVIQDSRTGVTITTKEVWEIMGKTSNSLETTNEFIIEKWKLETPIGLL